jgi:hypothetical protein
MRSDAEDVRAADLGDISVLCQGKGREKSYREAVQDGPFPA